MADTTCTGPETRPSNDGPIVHACLCDQCKGRRQVQTRYVEPGFTTELLADIPDEEVF